MAGATSKHLWKHGVILRKETTLQDAEFFKRFCNKIIHDDGSCYFLFCCTEIDTSHFCYLEMTTFKLEDSILNKIKIPHSSVLFIWESPEDEKRMGFHLQPE